MDMKEIVKNSVIPIRCQKSSKKNRCNNRSPENCGFVCYAVPRIPPHSINLAESICQRADR